MRNNMKISANDKITLAFATIFICLGAFAQVNAQDKPNILFIAFDDLRPLIGAYGEPEPKTPNLDAFAKEAVLFNKAYVNYPLQSLKSFNVDRCAI